MLEIALLMAPLAGLLAGEFSDEVLASIDGSRKWLATASLEANPFRDKTRLLEDYRAAEAKHLPDSRELKSLHRKLEKLSQQASAEPDLGWRLIDLRCELAQDMGREREARELAWSCVEAYPALEYEDARIHSSFQHLIARAAKLELGQSPPESVCKRIEQAYQGVPFACAFPTDELVEHLVRSGGRSELLALSAQIADRWLALAEADESHAERWTGWAREAALLETRLPRLVDGDRDRLYYLLEPLEPGPAPRALVLVLPGGTGRSLDFLPFVRNLQEEVGGDYSFVLIDAPVWSAEQASEIVWVREHQRKRYREARFGSEDLVHSVYAHLIADASRSFAGVTLLAWSSAGQTAYACCLEKHGPFERALILGSIFQPQELEVQHAKGKRFFLAQGREDSITPVRFAELAAKDLGEEGAKVVLELFEGGHGWAMPEGSTEFARRALDQLFDDSAW